MRHLFNIISIQEMIILKDQLHQWNYLSKDFVRVFTSMLYAGPPMDARLRLFHDVSQYINAIHKIYIVGLQLSDAQRKVHSVITLKAIRGVSFQT